jgi:hypothetical protein
MEITCKKCGEKQHWVNQSHCMNPECSDRLSQWSIASQLKAKEGQSRAEVF